MKYTNITILRKDSPYGNMKWQLLYTAENGHIFHDWFKTQREAINKKEHLESEFAIHKFDYLNK